MVARGWALEVDGRYGPASADACYSFQLEEGTRGGWGSRPGHVGHDVERADHVVIGFRVAAFILGAVVIVDALIAHASAVQWVSGLILVGIVPPEAVVSRIRRHVNGGR